MVLGVGLRQPAVLALAAHAPARVGLLAVGGQDRLARALVAADGGPLPVGVEAHAHAAVLPWFRAAAAASSSA
ncbi:hypothetical protein GZL_02217 [Streptomyces sp. 769]|nr:hypothetical protein GZL_02217 [Streptomyces sp. 769]